MIHYLIAFCGVVAWGLAWLWLYRSLMSLTKPRNRRGGRLGRLLSVNRRIQ